MNERGLSSLFNTIILQICFSTDAFPCRLPRSIWLLLRANSPLHKCFLRAKGYLHFCGLLPAVFLWKTFLSLQTLLPLVHSLLPHHFTCFLPFAACLCLAEMGWVVVCGRGAGEGSVGLLGELHGDSCQVKEYGMGMGTEKWVREPGNYSEHCRAPQHCLTLSCISEFVLNPRTLS